MFTELKGIPFIGRKDDRETGKLIFLYMPKNHEGYISLNYPPIRRATIGVLRAGKRKNMVHSLVEIDVSAARENLRVHRRNSKEYVSFLGYLIHCISYLVNQNKMMHAYRNRKNQLILFDQVDVCTTIERKIANNHEVVAYIIRGANYKSASQISKEIKEEKERDVREAEVFGSIKLFLAIPSFFRQWIFRFLDKAPRIIKKRAGTILVTSASLAGEGAGWGIPIATHTLNVTIGGIVDRMVERNRQYEKRQHQCLTLSFDHDIIDGAPAARFIRDLKKIVERGVMNL